jgi:S-adenosylmethionine hydrolase
MAIITLTTDLGLKDYYVSAIKGSIFKIIPKANIIDISHQITPFDILQASFILKNAYHEFPEKTVHLIGINAETKKDIHHFAVFADNHFFVGADNGIFSLMFENIIIKSVLLSDSLQNDSPSFPLKDKLLRAACHIAEKGEIDSLGKEMPLSVERKLLQPILNEKSIKGSVLYIDGYENVITNISKDLFDKVGKKRGFTIFFRTSEYEVNVVSNQYSDVPEGELLMIFGSSLNLEIAINKGRASGLLGLKPGDMVRIEFG